MSKSKTDLEIAQERLIFAACQFAVAKKLRLKLPNSDRIPSAVMDAHEALDDAAIEYFKAAIMVDDK